MPLVVPLFTDPASIKGLIREEPDSRSSSPLNLQRILSAGLRFLDAATNLPTAPASSDLRSERPTLSGAALTRPAKAFGRNSGLNDARFE
jgi:hypothetical protein